MFLAIFLGALFGFALFYAHASNPDRILQMLRLKDLSLMKTILFAIGLANVLIAVAYYIGIFDTGHFSIKATNLGVVLGGMIFGVGFGLVGTCPGTGLAALTSGFFHRVIGTVFGGIFGALTFSLAYGYFDHLGLFKIINLGNVTLFKIADKIPSIWSIGFGGLLMMGISLMVVAAILPIKTKI